MQLKKKQKHALDMLKQGYNVFLSGEAGTGKSFVIERFKEYLEENNVKYVVGAPTGLAALNVGGITLHRMFGLSINILDFGATMKNVEEAEVLIIDEISMCRKDIFQKIARAIFSFENPIQEFSIEKERKVCRKKQIVVVGDFFQLPPILTDTDAETIKQYPEYKIELSKDDLYAFQCIEWENFNFKNVVLNEVVRQTDKEYIDNLNMIRQGNEKGLDFIQKKSKKTKTKNAIYLCSTNKDAEQLNQYNLKKIRDREYEYWAEETGEVTSSDRATQKCLKLKVGARVMSLVNVKEDVVNGMVGAITRLTKDSVCVKFDNGIEHEFEKYKWEIQGFKKAKIQNQDNGKIEEKTVITSIGEFRQIPLKLAWAITIHKSQGQTYEAVNLNPIGCFAEGQLYVALSRAKDLKKLHLISKLQSSYLKTSEVVKEFYTKIEKESQEFREVVEKQEEYVSIEIPKSLEKAVLNFIENGVDNIVSNKEIKALHNEIEDLRGEIEKLKASAGRRPKIDKEVEKKIIELRIQKIGMNRIAKMVGCGDGTVRRVIQENQMLFK